MSNYAELLEKERQAYNENSDVHDLPPICFYWLNRYILPQLANFGYTGADHFFLVNLRRSYEQSGRRTRRFLSIGAGNCDTEVSLALDLLGSGASDFVIDCLDLNEHMLERGMAMAASQGLDRHIHPLCA